MSETVKTYGFYLGNKTARERDERNETFLLINIACFASVFWFVANIFAEIIRARARRSEWDICEKENLVSRLNIVETDFRISCTSKRMLEADKRIFHSDFRLEIIQMEFEGEQKMCWSKSVNTIVMKYCNITSSTLRTAVACVCCVCIRLNWSLLNNV